MSDDPVAAMDALLDRLAAVLAGAGQAGGTTTGSAADGLINAVVGADGRVRELDLHPRLLRKPEQVAPGIVTAVNEAIAAARTTGTGSTAMIDELKAVQADSVEVTKQINASLVATLERLKGP